MRDAVSALLQRSCDLHQFSREIGEKLWTAGSEVDIVLDANPAPARTVNARLDGYDGTRPQDCLDGFRETRRFVDFQPEAVTETVTERLAVAALLYVAPSQSVGFLPLHPRAYRLGGDGIGVTHYVVNIALFRGRAAHHHRAGDIRAIAFVLGTKIEEQQISRLDLARRRPRVGQLRPGPRCDYGGERKILAAFITQCVLEDSGDAQLCHARPDHLQCLRQRSRSYPAGVADERHFIGILGLAERFDQVHLRTPLPAATIRQQSLEIAVQQVSRFESDNVDSAQTRCQIP